jgi:DeoR family suf operon transcriptional repressor
MAQENVGPALAELPATRRALLIALRKRGEADAETLASELDITASAVRQHLQGLAAADLVVHRESADGGPGRPRHLYRLGAAAEALFPRAYGELTVELLDYIGDEDPQLVARAFERRRRARVERVQERLAGLDFAARVAEVARVLDEDGYLAEVERAPDGCFRILEHNCAILAVAQRYGHACGSEIAFLREVLPDADVTRVSHILTGATACTYEVRPRAAA